MSTPHTNKRITDYGSGTAHYLVTSPEPSQWLIDASGSRALYDEWQAANARGKELQKPWKASSLALAEARKRGAFTAEIEELTATHEGHAAALKRQSKVARKALHEFDMAVREFLHSADSRDALVTAALEADAKAKAAFADMLAAIEARDDLWKKVGSPAPAFHYSNRSVSYNTPGVVSGAKSTFDNVTAHFPTRAQIEASFAKRDAETESH